MFWIIIGTAIVFSCAALGTIAFWGASQLIYPPEPDPEGSPSDYGLPYLEVVFPSRDRLRLHGWFIPSERSPLPPLADDDWSGDSKGTVIFCHGRFGSKDPDLKYAPFFREAGYNTFLFDFRGHGRSEGEYSSFGYYERLDLLGAIDLLQSKGISRFGVLGFSLGGVVGIATAAQSEAIMAVISDGGFAEVRKVVEAGSRKKGFPTLLAALIVPLMLWMAGRRLGCDLSEADSLRWVDKITPRALLLIHGAEDPYISVEDVRRLYEAAGEPKELWIVSEAGHRQVDEVRPAEYRRRVLGFFDRYLASEGTS
ncbi:MAG: alpha/beta hydrolase [Anaerolineae bacterium]